MMNTDKEIEKLAKEYLDTLKVVSKNEFNSIPLAFIAGAKSQIMSEWVSVENPPKDGEIYDIVCWWKDSHKQEERKGYIFKEKHCIVDWVNFFQQYGFYNNGLYEESFGLDENIITHYRLHQPLPPPPQTSK